LHATRRLLLAGLAVLCLGAAPAPPGTVRVRLVTSAGPIVVALDARRAPKTTANFLAYVDDGRYDGTSFYRAARRRTAPRFGFIQGGIDTDVRRSLPGVEHEPTDRTGIRHLDATISMARFGRLGSAAGNFFITVGPMPSMDARPGAPGYAAFGRVVEGMGVVRYILGRPSGGGSDAMKGQMILRPVAILRAERLDGVPKPTGRPRPWLLKIRPD
jgi:peptidyl-prolyl cis-trans isomerase A (cyclophilin A)